MYITILIYFCLFTGIYGCRAVNSDCLVYPQGCTDDRDEICCTVSWRVACCCRDAVTMTDAVTESFNTTYSFLSIHNATDSTPVFVTSEKYNVQVSFDQSMNGKVNLSLSVSLTSGKVGILYAASDNSTSLRMHLDARSVFIVSVLVLLGVFVIAMTICLLICKSDRLRAYVIRQLRRYLHERYSPPPSLYEL